MKFQYTVVFLATDQSVSAVYTLAKHHLAASLADHQCVKQTVFVFHGYLHGHKLGIVINLMDRKPGKSLQPVKLFEQEKSVLPDFFNPSIGLHDDTMNDVR